MKTYEDVDAYLAAAPAEARPHLEELRRIVTSTVPKAEERIWYGVPFYFYEDGELAGFDALTKHVSFGFGKGVLPDDDREALEAKGYKLGKETLQIRFDQKIPVTAVRQILRTKARANRAARGEKGA